MGIREAMNKHPQWAVGILAGVVVAAAAYAYVGVREPDYAEGSKAFYTADHGQTWFADTVYKVVPYEKDGKQVVRAKVFTDGKKEFVCYLERYKEDARKRLVEQVKEARDRGQDEQAAFTSAGLSMSSIEVKKPGEGGQWTAITDPAKAAKVYGELQQAAAGGGKIQAVLP